MSRIARMVVALTATAGAAVFAAPAIASAAPTNCSTYYINAQYNTPVGAYSVCGQGSGSHRVVVGCRSAVGYTYTNYGPWKPAGQSSDRFCSSGDVAISKSYQVTG